MSVSRDELHELVEALPDEQVEVVAADLKARLAQLRAVSWPLAWIGIAPGSSPDISQRVDEILAEGLGRRRLRWRWRDGARGCATTAV